MMNITTPQPIRILCVFSRLDRGGSETMCMNLYRHIDRRLVQFDFVKHTPDKCAFEDEIMAMGGRIFEAPQYRLYNHFKYCKWWNCHFAAHKEHFIIHGHYFTISAIYFRIAHLYSRVTVAHSHCTEPLSSTFIDKIKLMVSKKTELHSDYALACSKAAGTWLFPHMEYKVFANAIDINKFIFNEQIREKKRIELEYSNSDIVIGHVGRFDFQKNHFFLLNLFKKLYKQNSRYKLMLVGDGILRSVIEKKIDDLQLNAVVKILGVRTDVNHLMMAMDLFLFPSFFEGLGVVAIEAQSIGLPCILSDAVPNEAVIIPICYRLPLQEAVWFKKVDSIIKQLPKKRISFIQRIINSGYDIHDTSQWLQCFYVQIANRTCSKRN